MKRRVVFGAGGVIVAALSVLAAAAVGAFASGSPTKVQDKQQRLAAASPHRVPRR